MTNAPVYLQMNKGGSVARMFELKRVVFESTNGNRPPSHAVADWRKAREYGFHNWSAAFGELSQGFNTKNAGSQYETKTPIWYCHTGEQFRDEQDVNNISVDGYTHIKHTGWFTNNDQNEKSVGIVGRLSHGRFVAGYRWTSNDERVYFNEVFTDIRDACIFADSHAEDFADIAREDDEKAQSAHQLEDENEDSFVRLSECLTMRNNSCFDYVRDEIHGLIQRIRLNRDRLINEFGDYV